MRARRDVSPLFKAQSIRDLRSDGSSAIRHQSSTVIAATKRRNRRGRERQMSPFKIAFLAGATTPWTRMSGVRRVSLPDGGARGSDRHFSAHPHVSRVRRPRGCATTPRFLTGFPLGGPLAGAARVRLFRSPNASARDTSELQGPYRGLPPIHTPPNNPPPAVRALH